MHEATMNLSGGTREGITPAGVIPLALKVLLVGFICHFSTEIGFAHKFPPHYISPLWPTGAILFSVLVATPIRHWWAYTLAAYFTSIVNDARAGFPVAAILFVAAGLVEIFIAAVGVRRFAGGLRAFDSLSNLVAYIVVAVVLGPLISAFLAAFAGAMENYWFYWRVWFLSEALAYLMLAPAILTWIASASYRFKNISGARCIEAFLIGCGLLAISIRVFTWQTAGQDTFPALLYLPLPLLLWAAVRFGPVGVTTALLVVTLFSISGAVQGQGPFAASTPAENVLSLQLFLIMMSLPLLFLAALIEEGRAKTNALSESELRFRSMADTAPVMIWMSGPDRLCTFFNKGWLDFTGRTLEQELGEGWSAGVHPDDFDRCREVYIHSFNSRQEFTMEYRLRRYAGEYRWILGEGVPRFAPDGKFLGYIGCATDITERKRTESELRRQREELAHVTRVSTMGELAASLAHELNQPLTAIYSNAQAAQRFMAADPADLEEVREILKDIVQDNSRAGEVIHRMRALVKKQEITFVPLDLSSVIRDVVLLVHSDAILHNIRVSLELDPSLPPVQGDKVELQQVVLNLLLNAFEAMKDCPASQREINVRAALDGADVVRVVVHDRGTGMRSENLDKIFQPFYTTKRDGLGMGLSISRSIIEAHGGRLWAENNSDRGATFCFTVPVGGSVEGRGSSDEGQGTRERL
jgi:two-component system, LuxR family, sensor kinase FixL